MIWHVLFTLKIPLITMLPSTRSILTPAVRNVRFLASVAQSKSAGSNAVHSKSTGLNSVPETRSPVDALDMTEDEKRQEAAKLAMQSIKDIGSLFSLSGSDDPATQPIDTTPIFEDPAKFAGLSLLHQGQVLKELQDKFDKNWHKLSLQDKKLGYYIAYGDWGVREEFSDWKLMSPPLDLPFYLPSAIKTTTPDKNTPVKKVEQVILAETPVRRKQFDFKKMDPVTKFFIYLTAFITVGALFRDKKIGEDGRPEEVKIVDPYQIAREQRLLEEQKEAEARLNKKEQSNKKWYYLWLR